MAKKQISIKKFLKFSFVKFKLIFPISFVLSFAIVGMSFVQMEQASNFISTLQAPSPIAYDDAFYSQNIMSSSNVSSTESLLQTYLSVNKVEIQVDIFSACLFSALDNPYTKDNNTNLLIISANLNSLAQNDSPWSQIIQSNDLKYQLKENPNQMFILNNSLFGIGKCNISSFDSKNTTIACNNPLKLLSLFQPVISEIKDIKDESIEVILFDISKIQDFQFNNLNWTTFIGFKWGSITQKDLSNNIMDLKISNISYGELHFFFKENPIFSRINQHDVLLSMYNQETLIDIFLFLTIIIFGFWMSNKILSAYIDKDRKMFYQLIYLGGDLTNSDSKITGQIVRILITTIGLSTGLIVIIYLLLLRLIGYLDQSFNIQTGILFSFNNVPFDISDLLSDVISIPILLMLVLFMFMIISYLITLKKVIRTNIRYLVIKSKINSLIQSEGADRINSNTVEPSKYYFSWFYPLICIISFIGAMIILFWCADFRSSIGSGSNIFNSFYPLILWVIYIVITIQLVNLLWYGLFRIENYILRSIYRIIFRLKKFEILLLLKIKSFSLTHLKLILVVLNLVVIPIGIFTQFNSIQQTTMNYEKNINLNSDVFEITDNGFNHSNENYFDYMNEINNTLSNIQDQYSNIPISWTFCYEFSVILPNGSFGKIYQISNERQFEYFVHEQLRDNISLQPESFVLNSEYAKVSNLSSNTLKLRNFSGDNFTLAINKKADQFPGIFEKIGSSNQAISKVIGVIGADSDFSEEFSIDNITLFISNNGFNGENGVFNTFLSKTFPLLLSKEGWSVTQRIFNFNNPMTISFIHPLQIYAFICEFFIIFGISLVYMISFVRNYTFPDKRLLHKFGVKKSTLKYPLWHLFLIWGILITGILLIVNLVGFGFNSII